MFLIGPFDLLLYLLLNSNQVKDYGKYQARKCANFDDQANSRASLLVSAAYLARLYSRVKKKQVSMQSFEILTDSFL